MNGQQPVILCVCTSNDHDHEISQCKRPAASNAVVPERGTVDDDGLCEVCRQLNIESQNQMSF